MKRRDFLQSVTAASVLISGKASAFSNIANSLAEQAPAGRDSAASTSHGRDFFYRPENGWTADVQPFYKDGKFWLFFSPAWRDVAHCPKGEPLYWPGSWYLITTEDFVHFTEHGQVLPRGNRNQQDLGCFAGSVIESEGQYHIFYAGNNRYFPKEGKPEDGIMHAVSHDLLHWVKIPEDAFCAAPGIYSLNDWRDPFVFWNEEAKEYWMLVVAQLKTGPPRRRGCTALCVSRDLKKWDVREPFWAPGLYVDHECPDLFRIGDWWYLLFSEFSDQHRTHYRMSRSLKGPWHAPDNDSLDGRAYYAAKTAFDGHRRFAFGWNPTRYDKIDYLRASRDAGFTPCKPYPSDIELGPSGWDWGGNLVVHEIIQEADGTLSVKVPDSVDRAFSQNLDFQFQNGMGPIEISSDGVQLDAPEGFACSPAGVMPRRCKIETTVVFEKNTRGCGLMLRVSDDLDSAYYFRLEPMRNRLVFDTWPRSGDIPFDAGVARPITLSPNTSIDLKIFVDDIVCVVYADNRVAMNGRLYDLKHGRWGVFVNEGSAKFHNSRISTL
jgi:beta-fructofuranosidase